MSPAEVERQREKIMRAPLIVRDREYPFSEDVIVDETGAVDPNLGVMAKVSSLIEVLRLGGSYELVYFLLSVSTWMSHGHATRSWLVFIFAPYFLRSLCASNLLAFLVYHPEWDVSADSVSLHQLSKVAGEL